MFLVEFQADSINFFIVVQKQEFSLLAAMSFILCLIFPSEFQANLATQY